jgi:hypothetical protein
MLTGSSCCESARVGARVGVRVGVREGMMESAKRYDQANRGLGAYCVAGGVACILNTRKPTVHGVFAIL